MHHFVKSGESFQKWWEFMNSNKDYHYSLPRQFIIICVWRVKIDFPLFCVYNLRRDLLSVEKILINWLLQNSTRLTHLLAFHRRTTAHQKWRITKWMSRGISRRNERTSPSLRLVRINVNFVKNLFRASDTWRNMNRWVSELLKVPDEFIRQRTDLKCPQ